MKQIGLINFVDVASRQQGIAVVRAGAGEIGLALSLEEDGDTEAFLGIADCEQLLAALQAALSEAKAPALAALTN